MKRGEGRLRKVCPRLLGECPGKAGDTLYVWKNGTSPAARLPRVQGASECSAYGGPSGRVGSALLRPRLRRPFGIIGDTFSR